MCVCVCWGRTMLDPIILGYHNNRCGCVWFVDRWGTEMLEMASRDSLRSWLWRRVERPVSGGRAAAATIDQIMWSPERDDPQAPRARTSEILTQWRSIEDPLANAALRVGNKGHSLHRRHGNWSGVEAWAASLRQPQSCNVTLTLELLSQIIFTMVDIAATTRRRRLNALGSISAARWRNPRAPIVAQINAISSFFRRSEPLSSVRFSALHVSSACAGWGLTGLNVSAGRAQFDHSTGGFVSFQDGVSEVSG